MKHYICTGDCKGVSDEFGVCQAPDCLKHGEGRHYDRQGDEDDNFVK